MQGLQKISTQQPRLADQVYNQILDGLQSGAISSDDRLHQVNLAQQLSVSRTPVREALLRLEQEGMLTSTSNGGFKVREIREQDVRDIYQTRQAIEGFSAGLLAQTADDEALENLRKIIRDQEALTPQNAKEFYQANRTIHRAFVEATNNAYLVEHFDVLWNRSYAVQFFEALDEPKLAQSLKGHLTLCDMIAKGRFDDAQSAMHAHIAEGCTLQLTTF